MKTSMNQTGNCEFNRTLFCKEKINTMVFIRPKCQGKHHCVYTDVMPHPEKDKTDKKLNEKIDNERT
jgi:hypothetical protein